LAAVFLAAAFFGAAPLVRFPPIPPSFAAFMFCVLLTTVQSAAVYWIAPVTTNIVEGRLV